MSVADSSDLCAQIGAFLQDCRIAAQMESCRGFWQTRPFITASEIAVLEALGEEPRCADAVAAMLGRDLSCTEELLAALVSVGLLERSDGRYLAIPATVAYCRAVRAGLFDAAGEPRD